MFGYRERNITKEVKDIEELLANESADEEVLRLVVPASLHRSRHFADKAFLYEKDS
jgi:hypothetical protein